MTNQRGGLVDHSPRILIVDDERSNRQLLEVMLATEGFVLLTATRGEEALAIVAQQPPDLILLDVMMPGMDGYQVASSIKSNPSTGHIPVIMVTAMDDRHAVMLGLSAGAEDVLSRPLDRAELCTRVKNLLRLRAHSVDKYNAMLEREVDSRTAGLLERAKTLEAQLEQAQQQVLALSHQQVLPPIAADTNSPVRGHDEQTPLFTDALNRWVREVLGR
jgi:DNA-binding response OmpR family regulator